VTAAAPFSALPDVLNAFDERHLKIHEWVWVRFSGELDDDDEGETPIKEETLSAALASSSGSTAVIALMKMVP